MNKTEIAKKIHSMLDDVNCEKECPLKEVCDLVCNESHNNTICKILDLEKVEVEV